MAYPYSDNQNSSFEKMGCIFKGLGEDPFLDLLYSNWSLNYRHFLLRKIIFIRCGQSFALTHNLQTLIPVITPQ